MQFNTPNSLTSAFSRNIFFVVVSIAFILINIGNANALTYSFDGTVTYADFKQPSDSVLPQPISSGETFTGYFSYEFEQTLEPSNTYSDGSSFSSSSYTTSNTLLISYVINIGYLTVYGNSNLGTMKEIVLTNDLNFADSFDLIDPVPLTTPNLNYYDGGDFGCVDEVSFNFDDTSGTLLTDTALMEAMDFTSFDKRILMIDGVRGSSGLISFSLSGNICNIIAQPVPEPGTILLISAGIGAVILRKNRKIS